MPREQLAALVLATTALAAAGCGSSSKSGSATTAASTAAPSTTVATTTTSNRLPPAVTVPVASGKPLTRAQWLAKGDAICAHLFKELKPLSIKGTEELPRVLPQAAAYERAAVAELAKLVPPASKARHWQTILRTTLRSAEAEAKLAEYGKLGAAITKSPVATAMIALQKHLGEMAKHEGFKVCSRL
jgi:hypothetical protein